LLLKDHEILREPVVVVQVQMMIISSWCLSINSKVLCCFSFIYYKRRLQKMVWRR
jgi:hypothetical protein